MEKYRIRCSSVSYLPKSRHEEQKGDREPKRCVAYCYLSTNTHRQPSALTNPSTPSLPPGPYIARHPAYHPLAAPIPTDRSPPPPPPPPIATQGTPRRPPRGPKDKAVLVVSTIPLVERGVGMGERTGARKREETRNARNGVSETTRAGCGGRGSGVVRRNERKSGLRLPGSLAKLSGCASLTPPRNFGAGNHRNVDGFFEIILSTHHRFRIRRLATVIHNYRLFTEQHRYPLSAPVYPLSSAASTRGINNSQETQKLNESKNTEYDQAYKLVRVDDVTRLSEPRTVGRRNDRGVGRSANARRLAQLDAGVARDAKCRRERSRQRALRSPWSPSECPAATSYIV
ncbi:hypothetical protein EAG_09790 [Camponotus floridanus]|uniref:Uncharacterized protein n=1 Tax=Camponotus floridanus TaxID=104421 RepID=E2AUR9_CAMFO|nr:hypothetical protein EAG_09790 [Camponotus floridanus]